MPTERLMGVHTISSMRRTLVILGLCTALGACSSGAGSKASSSSTTAAPSEASTGLPATSSVAAATPGTTAAVATSGAVKPCGIVTTDDVAAAFGGTVAPGVVNPDNGGCDYEITGKTNTGDSGTLTQVSIKFSGDYESFDHTKVVFPDIEKVDGLGSEAWYYSFGSQLHISLRGQELLISGKFPGDAAAVKAEVVAFGHTVTAKL